jgi:predicted acetyltransferase
MQTTLLPVTDTDKPTLANLTQFYLYDSSESNGLDVDAHGCYDASHLTVSWCTADCKLFFIHVDDQLAGFAVVNCAGRLHTSFDGHAIAGFFVLRKYRYIGVGRAAATQLFDRFPGRWEVATFALNIPALAFWRSVIDRYTNGRYDEQWQQVANWRGHIQSFTTPVR